MRSFTFPSLLSGTLSPFNTGLTLTKAASICLSASNIWLNNESDVLASLQTESPVKIRIVIRKTRSAWRNRCSPMNLIPITSVTNPIPIVPAILNIFPAILEVNCWIGCLIGVTTSILKRNLTISALN